MPQHAAAQPAGIDAQAGTPDDIDETELPEASTSNTDGSRWAQMVPTSGPTKVSASTCILLENSEVAKPRFTHMLIKEGNNKTCKMMTMGLLVVVVLLVMNFALNVLAVSLQKDAKVTNHDAPMAPVLRDVTHGKMLSIQAVKWNTTLVTLPEVEITYLLGMESLLVYTDQGSMYVFLISICKFKPVPGNQSLFKFSLGTKGGHVLTWNRPLQRSDGSNFVFANDDDIDQGLSDITITHATEDTETVTESPAGLQWGARSGSGGWVFSNMPGQNDIWKPSASSGRRLENVSLHRELRHHRRQRRGCGSQQSCATITTRAPPLMP
jgi:hypothetical protein